MPFIVSDVEEKIEQKRQTDPEFRKAWDESCAEYELIGEMISLCKQGKITQSQLDALTGKR